MKNYDQSGFKAYIRLFLKIAAVIVSVWAGLIVGYATASSCEPQSSCSRYSTVIVYGTMALFGLAALLLVRYYGAIFKSLRITPTSDLTKRQRNIRAIFIGFVILVLIIMYASPTEFNL